MPSTPFDSSERPSRKAISARTAPAAKLSAPAGRKHAPAVSAPVGATP
jgi:hypothetical protein